MSQSKLVICPYCGATQPAADACRECRGLFEPLSRQATHNEMGPWYLRERPHHPGCSYETLVRLVERGIVTKYSIVRGPTTKQFWTVAKHVPGVVHVLGFCHVCDATVDAEAHGCPECGVPFGAYLDRNHLGLPEVRPLAWESPQSGWGPPATSGARGLSSFAADEELLADHPAGAMVPRASATAALRSPEPAHPPGARIEASDSPQAADLRLLRKRLYRQDRTIGRLRNVVVVVAVAAAVLQLLTLTMLRGRGDRGPAQGSAPLAAPVDDRVSPPVATSAAAASVERAEPLEVEPTPIVEPPMLEEPPVETPANADAGLDAALALERDAENSAWPVTDRIRAYEDALAILRDLGDPEAGPTIRTRIERLETAVERLRLREFFP